MNLKIFLSVCIITSTSVVYASGDPAFDIGVQVGKGLVWSSQKGSDMSSEATTGDNNTNSGYSSKEQEMLNFISSNMNTLAYDSASGEGSTLEALSILMKVDTKKLSQNMQANFTDIFFSENTTPESVFKKIKTL